MLDLLKLSLRVALLPEAQRRQIDAWISAQMTQQQTSEDVYRKMAAMLNGDAKIPA